MTSFAALLAPVAPERFLDEVRDRTWLQVEAGAEKTRDLISWDALARLLEMDVWTDRTLQLVLDRQRVPVEAYCREARDRSHQPVRKPDGQLVQQWLARGASLLLNEIETLHPPIRAVAECLERTLGAKASANLYCSWQGHQAFDSHYDRHDVYAFQVVGRKRWRIYEGRADRPIEHAAFYNVPQAEYDRMKGAVAAEIAMTPGDLLYLPRGQFHDALAEDEASVHVTFSCSAPIGLDWLNDLWSIALQDPLFRTDLPTDETALAAHFSALGQRLAALAQDPETIRRSVAARMRFAPERPHVELPPPKAPSAGPATAPPMQGAAPQAPAAPRFAVARSDVKLRRAGAGWVLEDGTQPLRLTANDGEVAAWIAKTGRFDLKALAGAFPLHDQKRLADLVGELGRRGVIRRVA
jgi:ribosomal protein L16 Arg81 hydroxylase